ALTPLFDLVVVTLLNPPAEVVEPARWGLMVMLPFTWSIAYRRFHQGLLIRHGRSLTVSVGTVVRLVAIFLGMGAALLVDAPGIVVGASGIAAGVLAEAAFIGWRVRSVVRHELPAEVETPLSWGAFNRFYLPLALTSLLLLGVQPLGSAALSRMPHALLSLAAWPILSAFVFLFRGLGMAYNEVVVAALDEPGAWRSLRRFSLLLSLLMTATLLTVALSPLSPFFFGTVMGLSTELALLASSGLLLAVLWPALTVYQSLYQGVLMYGNKTPYITQAVVASLFVSALLLVAGVFFGTLSGLYVATASFVVGSAVQVLWLAFCSRGVLRQLRARERLEDLGLEQTAATNT
ncbi:MAG: hypothetical protein M3511_16280, partial [Deinococcota bacterium]|nr:hypothetical protein [Deinococcota bacterium]